jgi:hypothetical protein
MNSNQPPTVTKPVVAPTVATSSIAPPTQTSSTAPASKPVAGAQPQTGSTTNQSAVKQTIIPTTVLKAAPNPVVRYESMLKHTTHVPGMMPPPPLPSSGTSAAATSSTQDKKKSSGLPSAPSSSSNLHGGSWENHAVGALSQVDYFVEQLDVKETVLKIMQRVIPPNVAIDPAARDLVFNCMLEFASSLSNEAVVFSAQMGQRTIVGKHFEHAVSVLGYEDYNKPIATFNVKREEHITKGCTTCGGKLEPFRKKPAPANKSTKVTKPPKNTTVPIDQTSKTESENVEAPPTRAPSTAAPRIRSHQAGWELMDAEGKIMFAERLKAAMNKKDPKEDLKSMSKDLNITMKVLKQKLAE